VRARGLDRGDAAGGRCRGSSTGYREVISTYHQGLTPLIVPITLFNHYVRNYQEPYLARQTYLNPDTTAFKLRNHV
jgi:uncharacterized protein YbgA (DUF1722 family)